MTEQIDIRASLHAVQGLLRRNQLIDAFELVNKMSVQMDDEFYNAENKDVAWLSKSTLAICANVFRAYEKHHAAKPDIEKATKNAEHAALCEKTIEVIERRWCV